MPGRDPGGAPPVRRRDSLVLPNMWRQRRDPRLERDIVGLQRARLGSLITMTANRIQERFQVWIDARTRHGLSHAHVQMARELGMNPKKLGKLDNDDQEPWKLPLPAFIEKLYSKRFHKTRPDVVMSIEERSRVEEQKKAARREAKRRHREGVP